MSRLLLIILLISSFSGYSQRKSKKRFVDPLRKLCERKNGFYHMAVCYHSEIHYHETICEGKKETHEMRDGRCKKKLPKKPVNPYCQKIYLLNRRGGITDSLTLELIDFKERLDCNRELLVEYLDKFKENRRNLKYCTKIRKLSENKNVSKHYVKEMKKFADKFNCTRDDYLKYFEIAKTHRRGQQTKKQCMRFIKEFNEKLENKKFLERFDLVDYYNAPKNQCNELQMEKDYDEIIDAHLIEKSSLLTDKELAAKNPKRGLQKCIEENGLLKKVECANEVRDILEKFPTKQARFEKTVELVLEKEELKACLHRSTSFEEKTACREDKNRLKVVSLKDKVSYPNFSINSNLLDNCKIEWRRMEKGILKSLTVKDLLYLRDRGCLILESSQNLVKTNLTDVPRNIFDQKFTTEISSSSEGFNAIWSKGNLYRSYFIENTTDEDIIALMIKKILVNLRPGFSYSMEVSGSASTAPSSIGAENLAIQRAEKTKIALEQVLKEKSIPIKIVSTEVKGPLFDQKEKIELYHQFQYAQVRVIQETNAQGEDCGKTVRQIGGKGLIEKEIHVGAAKSATLTMNAYTLPDEFQIDGIRKTWTLSIPSKKELPKIKESIERCEKSLVEMDPNKCNKLMFELAFMESFDEKNTLTHISSYGIKTNIKAIAKSIYTELKEVNKQLKGKKDCFKHLTQADHKIQGAMVGPGLIKNGMIKIRVKSYCEKANWGVTVKCNYK